MQVRSINYNQSYNRPSFKSWHRNVYQTIQQVDYSKNVPQVEFIRKLKHRNDTYIFRDDFFWKDLQKFLVEKYALVKKVNVFNYGCSNGSEAFTFIMQMLSNLDEAVAKKFLPIIAKDCDTVAIEKARSGKLPISEMEALTIQDFTNGQFDRFIDERIGDDENGTPLFRLKNELIKNVKFSVGDAIEDCQFLPRNGKRGNNVVFARNFWPYLSKTKKEDLAQNLYDNMGKNSTLIIGDYDLSWYDTYYEPIARTLSDVGFMRASEFIFER